MQNETRNCQNCKKDFTIESEDFNFYEKIKVPPPTWCPECRLERRLVWRNEHGLFRRKNNTPGSDNNIIAIFPDSSKAIVYEHDYWWSDKWDATNYGIDYDFSRPFFEQFNDLLYRVPLISLFDSKSVNTRFCNTVTEHKNCYMVSAGWSNEDSMYSNRISFCRETTDSYICHKLEFGYENIHCADSYRLMHSKQAYNCTDSYFLYDCRNCLDCFMCSNLRNKSYCIRNKQYTKEEYEKIIVDLGLDKSNNISKFKQEFKKLELNSVHRFSNIINCINVTGDNIANSKDSKYVFDLAGGAENTKYCNWGTYGLKDSYDTGPGTGGKSELTYEGVSIGVANSNCKFGAIVWNSNDVEYAFNCYNLKNCFGCISLRDKSYCILNKQYSKEEYEELVPKIKQHMMDMPYVDKRGNIYKYGEFLPGDLSPFPYNATVAQDYLPKDKQEALDKNYKWEEDSERNYTISLDNVSIPKSIKEVDDSILDEVLECENRQNKKSGCSEVFKIIEQELKFYQRLGIPLPLKCPKCRHNERLLEKNPNILYKRICMCDKNNHTHGEGSCEVEFETTYAPDRPEKVYCESCYNKEIY